LTTKNTSASNVAQPPPIRRQTAEPGEGPGFRGRASTVDASHEIL